ncbi:MAG: glucose-1-phosphate cytidylyltransferase [bacterium]|nr:glucose-1-phosphate cytidylyltransferase [bacterium]
MKVLILAGGYGTRLSEETGLKPKPMVEIGGKPMLWHIMKIYSTYGFNEFIILAGYKGYVIKEFFANYFIHQSDVTFDLKNNKVEVLKNSSEPWKVTILDTGQGTMTGGRVKRAQDYIKNEPFMLTYGDGVSNINIKDLVLSHEQSNSLMTLTAVQPEGRFGAIDIGSDNNVNSFAEKPKGDGHWINGGFFVCQPEVLNYINDDTTVFEQAPLRNIASESNLNAFKHNGFWQCMDTKRDMDNLNKMWDNNKADWKVW